jgi:hypothetical protein
MRERLRFAHTGNARRDLDIFLTFREIERNRQLRSKALSAISDHFL